MDKCYRCDEVISMCPCDESTYTADDEISRLRSELAECRTVKESLLVALERYGKHAPAGMPCGLCEAVSAALAAEEE